MEEMGGVTQVVGNFFSSFSLSSLCLFTPGNGGGCYSLKEKAPSHLLSPSLSPESAAPLSTQLKGLVERLGQVVPFLTMPSLERRCITVQRKYSKTTLPLPEEQGAPREKTGCWGTVLPALLLYLLCHLRTRLASRRAWGFK